jgi:hypothetical protein
MKLGPGLVFALALAAVNDAGEKRSRGRRRTLKLIVGR